MPRKKKAPVQIAAIDFETDPFKHGRRPRPFVLGFYDGQTFIPFWGADCVQQFANYVATLEGDWIFYAHNGGKFDFMYFLREEMLENPALIINGRIVECGMLGHKARDSFAILPSSLADMGEKKDIEYWKLESDVRHRHKTEIIDYLEQDCVELYRFVKPFRDRFGDKLTIGQTAFAEFKKLYPDFKRLNESHDERFRPYYFGGRVQCFETGVIKGDFHFYDVNSMYPDVMRNMQHPWGSTYLAMDGKTAEQLFNRRTGRFPNYVPNTYFMRWQGTNKGAVPIKTDTGLDFTQEEGEFFTCSHEIIAGLELGLIQIDKILEVHIAVETFDFRQYVDQFIIEKIEGKKTKNRQMEVFAKFLLNSLYGKMGSNPRKYKDFFMRDRGIENEREAIRHQRDFEEWLMEAEFEDDDGFIQTTARMVQDYGRFELWECAAEYDDWSFFDVAVASSIASASRSKLMRAIAGSVRPLYCDTDSLVCEKIGGVPIHDSDLGAWKWEGRTHQMNIAGKKLYAAKLLNADGTPMMGKDKKTGKQVQKVKIASKGAKLSYDDILAVCRGETVTWRNDAPSFKLDGSCEFTHRDIKLRNAA